ncbi:hypothetical protein AVEN_75042-1 [Araneus ventricosus]|uniref:Uncharacterized protein n=1 Tax=Araneus ventricosus TaxID=182803 RepID=A0A4Y2TE56_ARAVE|nr:hypothetical protein AVEN_75042-1 [Araneus ventricosus]
MTRTTPELAPPSPNFRATPTGGRLATTYDLACNRPHTRRIFSGIGFRACDPPVPRSRPYHQATAASMYREESRHHPLILASKATYPLNPRRVENDPETPPLAAPAHSTRRRTEIGS